VTHGPGAPHKRLRGPVFYVQGLLLGSSWARPRGSPGKPVQGPNRRGRSFLGGAHVRAGCAYRTCPLVPPVPPIIGPGGAPRAPRRRLSDSPTSPTGGDPHRRPRVTPRYRTAGGYGASRAALWDAPARRRAGRGTCLFIAPLQLTGRCPIIARLTAPRTRKESAC